MAMSDDRLADWIAVARQGNDAWVKSLALTEASVSESPFGDLERALAAVEAVLAEHAAVDGYCQRCTQDEEQPQPIGWWMPWPCPTVQAIARELLSEKKDSPPSGAL